MTTATLTLTEFLLARIAEDEATATHYHRLLCMRTACDADDCLWGADEQDAMERERVCTCGYPARILAECAAKRAFIRTNITAFAHMTERDGDSLMEGARRMHAYMLRALAAVYGDHPDYRDDWRP